MNFFSQQDRARRKTLWLVALLIAAVIALIAVTVLVLSSMLYFTQQPMDSPNMAQAAHTPFSQHLLHMLTSDLVYWVAAGVLLMVISGSFFKLIQLGGNGRKVAEALNGRLIPPNTQDPAERKVLNVVEEMALASGNPVPPVYVLEEQGINAFAAGTDRRNAVIGVTRGCIELLSRDELQGVIAHEFSHIHYGDMRLNLRLVAVLHGILLIGLIGSYMLRSSAYGGRSKNQGAQLGMGLALVILGYAGVFFGHLIRSAVSRQREYLADASAVQFTRNPAGIANALKKIGGANHHALLDAPKAGEFGHLYFGQGVSSALGSLTATHPPLSERIKRIEPDWNGEYITPVRQAPEPEPAPAKEEPRRPGLEMAMVLGSAALVEEIGNPGADSLADAQALIQGLPQAIYDAAHDPFMARALIYGLLIDRAHPNHLEQQLAHLKKAAHPVTFRAFKSLDEQVAQLPREQYLPLIELAMPALKAQSASQYEVFKRNLTALIRTDGKVSVFEWCLYRSVTQNCEGNSPKGNKKLSALSGPIAVVLSAVCAHGQNARPEAALKAAAEQLSGVDLPALKCQEGSFKELDQALRELAHLKPLEKPKLLKAIAACIHADHQVTPEEAELFRAIADSLNCPVPLHTMQS